LPVTGVTLLNKAVWGSFPVENRVLTGVALDRAAQRFTFFKLATPTETAIEFDISWEADDL